jgi:hypothetical protein
VAHGSTGAGNDQVRFDVALRVLAPDLQIVTPIRDEGIQREQAMAFLNARGRRPDLVAKERPDLIVFTGDAINSRDGLPIFRRCLSRMAAIAPTYAVRGNWDTWFFADVDECTVGMRFPGKVTIVYRREFVARR